jgi:hypothetical protein
MHNDLPALAAFCESIGLTLNSPDLRRLRRYTLAAWTYSGIKDGYLIVVAGYAGGDGRTSDVAMSVEDHLEFDHRNYSALSHGGQLTDADVAAIPGLIREWTSAATKNPLTSWRMAA